ncbi:hypothetical protein FOMPIDRAFT_1053588 [Fomitopsis schrenkii]|uniref:Uncharacterized protein n=1 Tax=Fomitopsis schrenkii TaxID=2126942 RepID=S8DU17_FOMSC|nr:hypothetical protein FOMPIDRAFT_1053588 [Fomitopsis schrenkii]
MPRLAHKDNCMWPSSQVNLAVPQRHESRQGLVGMGHFGGAHTDEMDLAAGRFHLLSLGVYVDLANIHVVFFSGRLRHSGTPPLAPPGVEEIAHWAYLFVLILYPASKLLLGTSKIALSATTSGNKSNDPHTVPPEVFHPQVPFPTVTHATLARDGGIIMDPEEHFTCTKHMFAAMLYHGLRQLPYNLHVDMQRMMDSITAHDPKINNGEPYRGRGWDYLPNSDVTWEPLAEDSQRSREVYPGRREVFERFYNELHVPHAQCVPHIGVKDVALDLPEDLRFLAGNEHAPVKQKKLSKPAIPKGKKKSQKVQHPLVIGQTGYLQMQTTGWAVSRDMIAEDDDMDEDDEQGIAQPEMDVDEEEEEQEQEQEDDDAHRGHEELSSGDEDHGSEPEQEPRDPPQKTREALDAEIDTAILATLPVEQRKNASDIPTPMKQFLSRFSSEDLKQVLEATRSAVNLVKSKPQQLQDIIQTLDGFEANAEKMPKFSAELLRGIGDYWNALKSLDIDPQIHSVWVNITHQRVMMSKTWVMQFLFQDCNALIQDLSAHP